jgi:hypothetical protein
VAALVLFWRFVCRVLHGPSPRGTFCAKSSKEES